VVLRTAGDARRRWSVSDQRLERITGDARGGVKEAPIRVGEEYRRRLGRPDAKLDEMLRWECR
jgi:hypothetical protein